MGHAEVFEIPEAVSAELLRDLVGIEMTEPGFTDFSRIRPERDDFGSPLRRIVLQRFAIIEHHHGFRDARNVTQRSRYGCSPKIGDDAKPDEERGAIRIEAGIT